MRIILFATAAVLATAPSLGRAQGEERQRIDTTFAFDKNGVVDLGHVSGDIVVTGWTKNDIKIFATIETGYLETSLSSSHVRITARSRRGRMGNSRYEVSVPIGTQVNVSSVSGDVRVRGVAGEVSARSVSGDVEVRDAINRVEIESVSGDLHASKLRGHVRVHTVSGDIRIEDIDGDLSSKTVSGSVELTGTVSGFESESVSGDVTFTGEVKSGGTFRANSHSGDLRLTLPANFAATFELQSFSGDVQTAFPMTIQPGDARSGRSRGHRLTGSVNGGGPRISLETFSGDINIDKGAQRPNREN